MSNATWHEEAGREHCCPEPEVCSKREDKEGPGEVGGEGREGVQ